MQARSSIESQIRAEFAFATLRLARIAAPSGHDWRSAEDSLTWFGGDVVSSTRHGASIFLDRTEPDAYDPDQFHIEMRLFWDHHDAGIAERPARRAILWATQGQRIGFRAKGLFRSANPLFLYASDIDQLLAQAIPTIEQAIAPTA